MQNLPEISKFAWGFWVFLVDFALFCLKALYHINRPNTPTFMVYMSKKTLCSTPPWIVPRLVTHMKHLLRVTCLAKIPPHLFSSANNNSTAGRLLKSGYANQLTSGKFCRLPVPRSNYSLPVLISLLTTKVTKWQQQWMMTWLSIHIKFNPWMNWMNIIYWRWMNDSISISKLTSLLF